MSTTLVLETEGPHARWTVEDPDRPGEIASAAFTGIDDEIMREWSGIEAIELRVRDEDIRTTLPRIAVVLAGIPGRAADKLDTASKIVIPAGIDVQGAILTPLNETTLRAEIANIVKIHPPVGWVVSGMNSHRNPIHEQHAAAIARDVTGCPVMEGRFWSDSLNAVERARAAGHAAAHVARLAELQGIGEQIVHRLGRPIEMRTPPIDSAALAALLNCPLLTSLARLFDTSGPHGTSLQARVTRSEKGYSCHCTDGCFEFESITQARTFAAQHLREQMAQYAKQLGMPESTVTLTQDDRYTQVRGRRGPARVFLETIITARCVR